MNGVYLPGRGYAINLGDASFKPFSSGKLTYDIFQDVIVFPVGYNSTTKVVSALCSIEWSEEDQSTRLENDPYGYDNTVKFNLLTETEYHTRHLASIIEFDQDVFIENAKLIE